MFNDRPCTFSDVNQPFVLLFVDVTQRKKNDETCPPSQERSHSSFGPNEENRSKSSRKRTETIPPRHLARSATLLCVGVEKRKANNEKREKEGRDRLPRLTVGHLLVAFVFRRRNPYILPPLIGKRERRRRTTEVTNRPPWSLSTSTIVRESSQNNQRKEKPPTVSRE